MQKHVIELPDTFTVGGTGFTTEVTIADFPAKIIAQLAIHGLKQKAVDGTSSVPAQLAGEAWQAVKVKGGMDATKAAEAWAKLDNTERKAYVANWTGLEANRQAILDAKAAARDKVLAALREGKWEVRMATEWHGVDVDVLREYAAIRAAAGKAFTFEKGTPTAKREAAIAEAYLALPDEKRAAIAKRVVDAKAERAKLADLI